MAETIDEATLIAWVDGELDPIAAARVAQAVAADPDLAALADRHRRMKARFTAAFGPIADEPVTMPRPVSAPGPAPVVSLAAVRARRAMRQVPPGSAPRWWRAGGALAASLLVGVLIGHGAGGPSGVADAPRALALAAPIAAALDGQLSGDRGAVRVTLSFKDRGGRYCRSFAGRNLSGVACHEQGGWQLRYATPVSAQKSDYRMAGDDTAQAQMVAAMIADQPLDRAGEDAARKAGWR